MLTAISCPNCEGRGCNYCQRVGFIGQDETNNYYLKPASGGKFKVLGIIPKPAPPSPLGKLLKFFFGLIAKQLAEPHDFVWSIKQRR